SLYRPVGLTQGLYHHQDMLAKDFNQPTINYTCQVRITECFIPANRMPLALGNAIARVVGISKFK
ncbi:MAG: hypothetical protein ABWU13_22270, partial [Limnospira maxima]